MSFDKLPPQQRIQAVNIDCMRHKDFALLAGVICMGESTVVSEGMPTAATNGCDKLYGAAFVQTLNRKQLRYVVLHENFHVALKHCTLYIAERASKENARRTNIAMDYVVNGMIEELDPDLVFVERPTEHLFIDAKYKGWSFPQVYNDLKDKDDEGGVGAGAGAGEGEPLDVHIRSTGGKGDIEKLHEAVDSANHQSALLAQKFRGTGKGGRDILGTAQERRTNWVDALREFMQTMCQGDQHSRFCPPNKRLLASGFIMPSHFTETVGEVVIACDTSGSMTGVYPVVFGEIARICASVRPEKVRVLWWDTTVCGEQTFMPHEYEQIATILKPKGGGGTTVSCVANYINEKQYKPVCVIMLSDGLIESDYIVPEAPTMWGIIGIKDFVPKAGKVFNISTGGV